MGATAPSPAERLLRLQRSAGNRTVNRIVDGRPTPVPVGLDPDLIQRVFNPATVNTNAHLRHAEDWGTMVGSKIKKNDVVLADDDAGKLALQERTIRSDVEWRPAVNVREDHAAAVPPDQQGYIRASSVTFDRPTLQSHYEGLINQILLDAEDLHDSLDGWLAKPEVVTFLLDKALRFNWWNGAGVNLQVFVSGLEKVQEKLDRIEEGATFVANAVEHWRTWMHPEREGEVDITDLKFMKSDLHEKGLGVLKVTFTKPLGPKDHKFADKTNVTVFLKPEDKSLEENLMGDKSTSVANQINEIVGLTNQDEKLQTLKMKADAEFGTLVEKAAGQSAEDIHKAFMAGQKNVKPLKQSFHETLVFAYLAGIDDLHRENVYWDDGRPYLIDADAVLSQDQMTNRGSGATTQSGFGSNYLNAEAQKNKQGIVSKSNAMNSKIMKVLLEDSVKRAKIFTAIKAAIRGRHGRVVPIKTNMWAGRLNSYTTAPEQPENGKKSKDQWLDKWASEAELVRETTGFNAEIGAGLFGLTGKSPDKAEYKIAIERAETKKDLEAGQLPFYVYYYDNGEVHHNGKVIWYGQTLDQAFSIIERHFA